MAATRSHHHEQDRGDRVQYFKQVVITWSIRSRGNVQRTHIMTTTPSTASA
jgi:hypothetical protein